MTTTTTTSSPEAETPGRPPRRRGRLRWILIGASALAAGGLLWRGHSAEAGPFGGGPWGHHGGLTDEEMDRFINKRLDRVLDHLDATDDQRARIKAVLNRAKPELKAFRAEKERIHREVEASLVAPTVDPNRLEQARRAALQQIEKGSLLATRTMTEIAQILTPEQRQKIAKFMAQHQR